MLRIKNNLDLGFDVVGKRNLSRKYINFERAYITEAPRYGASPPSNPAWDTDVSYSSKDEKMVNIDQQIEEYEIEKDNKELKKNDVKRKNNFMFVKNF